MSAKDDYLYPAPLPHDRVAIGGFATYSAMCREIDELRHWKAEATEVLREWEKVWDLVWDQIGRPVTELGRSQPQVVLRELQERER